MANCKDCFHYEACVNEVNRRMALKEGAEKCRTFKDKTLFVEVVRCKDCEHWGGITFGNICRRWTGLNVKNCTKPTDFCSYGERRGKEE